MHRFILTLTLLFLVIFSVNAAATEDLVSGDYRYRVLPDGTAEILRYLGEDTDITVPDSIEELKVTSIGNRAFGWNETLTTVIVPDSVISLGDNVFSESTALTSVSLPESLISIGDLVFQGCVKLEKAVLPGTLVRIGDNPFDRCDLITEVSLPENNPFYKVEDGVLFDLKKDQLISYPRGKEDASYVVPEWVTSIGLAAFSENTHLKKLTLPDSLSEVIGNPFCGCQSLGTISISEKHHLLEIKDGALFDKEHRKLIAYLWGSSQPVYSVPKGTAAIGQEAFYKHPELYMVILSDSVHSIGAAAFAESALETISLPDGIVKLEDSLFSGCKNLRSVVLPKNLIAIGNSVFYGCTFLRRISFPSSLRSIGSSAFYLCQSLTSVKIPEGVERIGNYAFTGCFYLQSVTLPKSLYEIGTDIFYGDEKINLDVSSGSYAEEWADANGIRHDPDPVNFIEGVEI